MFCIMGFLNVNCKCNLTLMSSLPLLIWENSLSSLLCFLALKVKELPSSFPSSLLEIPLWAHHAFPWLHCIVVLAKFHQMLSSQKEWNVKRGGVTGQSPRSHLALTFYMCLGWSRKNWNNSIDEAKFGSHFHVLLLSPHVYKLVAEWQYNTHFPAFLGQQPPSLLCFFNLIPFLSKKPFSVT